MIRLFRPLILLIVFAFSASSILAQTYTSYFIGDTNDVSTSTQGVTVLMGGATENDSAMAWFLKKSGGGDIVVIRATGGNSYNTYLYSQLGVTVNSVQTIVFNNATASWDPYVIKQIRNAEALWIAGGNQWDYVSYWKNTPIDSAINYLINIKHVPIGGTSAGMAVQGSIVNTAQNGSVTSAQALTDPYQSTVTLLKDSFLHNPILHEVITDTHYDNPDRRGRHTSFMARIMKDYGLAAKGIACEEYTAVCIDTNGIASVYGNYPNQEDYAYFLQSGCSNPNTPETCLSGQPLQWDRNHEALKVYKVSGTPTGTNTFNLRDWKTGVGGSWQNWYVTQGTLNVDSNASPLSCNKLGLEDVQIAETFINAYPNPAEVMTRIHISESLIGGKLLVHNVLGEELLQITILSVSLPLDMTGWSSGMYHITAIYHDRYSSLKIIKE